MTDKNYTLRCRRCDIVSELPSRDLPCPHCHQRGWTVLRRRVGEEVRVPVSQARQKWRTLVRKVEEGASVLLTRHGTPVATLADAQAREVLVATEERHREAQARALEEAHTALLASFDDTCVISKKALEVLVRGRPTS